MEITNDLKGLFKQFCDAYGIEKIDENDKVLVKTFFDWLYEEKHQKDLFYQDVLKELNVDVNNLRSMEIGKTVNDSVVLPYQTRIVTPDGKGFEKYGNRVIVANLRFHGKFPVLLQRQNGMDHVMPIDQYNFVMTQNPYKEEDIKDWVNFPQNFQRIAVGVYGDINDMDMERKIRMMEEFYQSLDPRSEPVKEDIVADYNYATVVTTKRSAR